MKQICQKNNDYFGAQKLVDDIKPLPISSSYVNDRCKFVQYCCVDMTVFVELGGLRTRVDRARPASPSMRPTIFLSKQLYTCQDKPLLDLRSSYHRMLL